MITDPISDMLTRIRNGLAVRKHDVVMPASRIKHEIAKILEREGWISRSELIQAGESSRHDQLKLMLKYKKSGRPAITSIKRVSRPGLRVYVGKAELPRVLNNLGIAIISTPAGLLTNREARERGVGGEVICEVY